MKPIGGIGLLIAAGLLLAGCGGTVTPPPTTSSSTAPTSGITAQQPTTTSEMPTSNPEDLVGWVGQYSYSEILGNENEPPVAAMGYGVSIYQMGTGFFAAVTLSGYGTTQSIMATVLGDATTVTLYFNAYIGPNPWKNADYATGDALLTLTKGEDGSISTTWEKMKPQSSGNSTPGPHFTTSSPSPTKTSTTSK